MKEVKVTCQSATLPGFLTLPTSTQGMVLFAHGSGSSRHSPRNQFVAKTLNAGGLGTLLIDLLTPEEEEIDLKTRELRFDIPFLADRLIETTHWLQENEETKPLKLGYFGSSTGAAAALIAAAKQKEHTSAVVSRGGRPDLAMPHLSEVTAPTLFIVGGDDFGVIELNQDAFDQLNCPKKLEIVEGATHLFEEPGKLEEVAAIARDWFSQNLV